MHRPQKSIIKNKTKFSSNKFKTIQKQNIEKKLFSENTQKALIIAIHKGAYFAKNLSANIDNAQNNALKEISDADNFQPVVKNYIKLTKPRQIEKIYIGDIVYFDACNRIISVHRRKNRLYRLAHPKNPIQKTLAANLDIAFIVISCQNSSFLPFAKNIKTVCSAQGILPILVATKEDLAKPEEKQIFLDFAKNENMHIIFSSLKKPADLKQFYKKTNIFGVLLGDTGVGKSTLFNALTGTRRKTSPLGKTNLGKHCTTSSLLHSFESGYIADTPGVKSFFI